MRVIMTGGGTGGHIYPALAIADKIKEVHRDADILFVGTERGLESTLVPENGYPIEFINVRGFDRKHLLKNVKVVAELLKGSIQAKNIIKRFKPDLVIGTGGYVCGPVVRAAAKLGVRCFIHEQNAFPGVTNKMLEPMVEKVFLGFPEAGKHFKHPEKHVTTGNPVRKAFFQVDKSKARLALGVPMDSFMVLSFGGSRGAEKINEIMTSVAESLQGVEGTELFFATGSVHYDSIIKKMGERGFKPGGNIHIMKYIDRMQDYLGAADLVISRSGALTVSEITVCGKACFLIPSPYVTGNHQYFNAKSVADKGGAVILQEKDITPDGVLDLIAKMKKNPELLATMEEGSRRAAPENACEIIYRELMI